MIIVRLNFIFSFSFFLMMFLFIVARTHIPYEPYCSLKKSQKLAFELVTARPPIVDLTQLATVLGAAAATAHFHATDGSLDRTIGLVGPSSALGVPAVARVGTLGGQIGAVVFLEQQIEIQKVEVLYQYIGAGFTKLLFHLRAAKNFLESG